MFASDVFCNDLKMYKMIKQKGELYTRIMQVALVYQ